MKNESWLYFYIVLNDYFRIPDGLRELRTLLEQHITNQGLAAIDRCGDSALNVSASLFLVLIMDYI